MTKYLSGRVKVRNYTGLTTDRYKYLGLDQAEPNLGNPIGSLPGVPSGTQFQIVSVDSRPGERFWVPIQGGLIPGSISVFEEGTLVGTLSSITQLNFVGSGIGVSASNLGIAATITVAPPGVDNSVLFKDSGDFATSTGLTFDDSTDLLSIGSALDINNGSRFRVTNTGLVGIGTTNPTQELHVIGDIRLTGTIVDQNNAAGNTGQVLVKNATGGLSFINQGSVQAGAGGNVKEFQYHNSGGLVDGATGVVYDVSTQFVGLGVANPSKRLDVSGDIRVDGTTNISNVVISGFTTHNANASFQDDDKLFFGTGLDLSIFHDGSNSYLKNINGNLILKNNAADYFRGINSSGAVELLFNGSKKFETTNTGVLVSGEFGATGTVSAAGLTISGIATLPQTSFTGDVEVQNLKVTGITTAGNIKIESNTLATQSGNLLLDSFAGTLQTNDVLFVNNVTDSTNKDTGSIVTQGGIGVEKSVNIEGNLHVGVAGTIFSTVSGIVTTGSDLFVGGNLNVLGDVVYDEVQGRNLLVTGISTFQGQITLASNIIPFANNTYDIGSSSLKLNEIFATSFKGNADTATVLANNRTFSISGDGNAVGVAFNGSNDVALNLSLTNTGVTADTYGSTVTIPVITVDAKGRVTAVTNTGINFGTATVQQAQTIQTQARSVSADHFLTFVTDNNATSGTFESLFTNAGVKYNSGTNTFKVVSGSIQNISTNGLSISRLDQGSIEIIRESDPFIDFKTGSSEDFDVRIQQLSNGFEFFTGGNGAAVSRLVINSDGHVVPKVDSTYDLGLTGTRWRNVFADNVTASITGNSDTATALQNVRTFTITGDVDAPSQNFDGTGNVTLNTTLDTVNSNVGTFGNTTGTSYSRITVDGKGRITAASEVSIDFLTSTVGTAENANKIRTITRDTNANHHISFVDSDNSSNSYENLYTDESLKYNPSTGLLTLGGSLHVTVNNVSGGGIEFGDDGDIVDLNDGYCSIRMANGVRIYSAEGGGSARLRLPTAGDAIILPEANAQYDIGSSALKFDNIFATTFNGAFQGTANFADALSTGRDFSATGDISASAVSFNGTGNVNLVTSLAASGVTAGTYGNSSGTQYAEITVDVKGRLTSATTRNINFSNATVQTAVQLQNNRNFSIDGNTGTNNAGDVIAAGVAFNGTQNVILRGKLKTISGLSAGQYGNDQNTPVVTVNDQGLVTAITQTGINFGTATVAQANKLTNPRTITVSGDISTDNIAFDGTANITLTNASLTATGVGAGTYGSDTQVPLITVDAKGRVTAATTTGINFSTATVSQANTIRTVRRGTDASHFLTFVDSNNVNNTYESVYTDGDLYYNPSSNVLYTQKIQPTQILNTSGGTGSTGNVPVANGSGGWNWGVAAAGSSLQIFSDETDSTTLHYLTFVEGSGDGTKNLRHDDQLHYNPSTNRLTVDRIRPANIEESTGNSGTSGEVPIANGSGGWAWGTANAGGAQSVQASEEDTGATRYIAFLNGNNGTQNSVFYDDQLTYNPSSNLFTLLAARITELQQSNGNTGTNGQVAMANGSGSWGWQTINLSSVPNSSNSDQIKTQSRGTAATHYVTFVDSNNGSLTAENLYTDAGISYNPSTNNLQVNGSISLNHDNDTGGGIRLSDDGDIVDLNDAYCSMRFTSGVRIMSGNGQLGTTPNTVRVTLGSNGAISCTDNITAFASDMRLKTNITPIESPLDKLMSLSGFTFTFNDTAAELGYNKEEIHVGVSAQEVKEVLPEAVAPAPADDNYMTVRYEKLVPLLIEAMKEQQQTIDDLKSRLEKLES